MPTRSFRDASGREWQVWMVMPTTTERRATDAAPADHDRRTQQKQRISLPGPLKHGWLAFQTRGEKRRLAPHPAGWESMSDDELRTLLSQATVIGTPRRLIE